MTSLYFQYSLYHQVLFYLFHHQVKKVLEHGHKVITTVAAGTTIYNNIIKSKDNSGSGSDEDNNDKDKNKDKNKDDKNVTDNNNKK